MSTKPRSLKIEKSDDAEIRRMLEISTLTDETRNALTEILVLSDTSLTAAADMRMSRQSRHNRIIKYSCRNHLQALIENAKSEAAFLSDPDLAKRLLREGSVSELGFTRTKLAKLAAHLKTKSVRQRDIEFDYNHLLNRPLRRDASGKAGKETIRANLIDIGGVFCEKGRLVIALACHYSNAMKAPVRGQMKMAASGVGQAHWTTVCMQDIFCARFFEILKSPAPGFGQSTSTHVRACLPAKWISDVRAGFTSEAKPQTRRDVG